MLHDGATLLSNPMPTSYLEDGAKSDHDDMEQEVPARKRISRRKGKARKLKFARKPAGRPYNRKRIAAGKDEPYKQYTPCGCKQTCGKECPCNENGTCCEKYCGCFRSCKNRFRGCHCVKGQCRSRQCPCFASARECDPDIYRNCWVRNQKMDENQSLLLRRIISRHPYGNAIVISSDSDEDTSEPEEGPKHVFSEGDDQILWEALQENELNSEVIDILKHFIDASHAEIKERCQMLMERYKEKQVKGSETSDQAKYEEKSFLDQTLTSALDSFDNLFCRGCLIFDCRLHGCSQDPIIPKEKRVDMTLKRTGIHVANNTLIMCWMHKGAKLKFAKHSSNPNCYAKVMFVAGDHRVGIFAKENIDAGGELFYDYRHGRDEAPA